MRWLDRVGTYAETLAELTRLQMTGRTAAALRAADQALSAVTDPYVRAEMHIRRISALINLARTAHYPGAVEEAFATVGELTEPYLHGHLHALAALTARQLGALERGATHLVHAARALAPPRAGTSTSPGAGTTSRWPTPTSASTARPWPL